MGSMMKADSERRELVRERRQARIERKQERRDARERKRSQIERAAAALSAIQRAAQEQVDAARRPDRDRGARAPRPGHRDPRRHRTRSTLRTASRTMDERAAGERRRPRESSGGSDDRQRCGRDGA